MIRKLLFLTLPVFLASFALAQCPWINPADCNSKCAICTNPVPPESCFYCSGPSGGEVGYTCHVTSCNHCSNQAPICQTPPPLPSGVKGKCSASATKVDMLLMSKENAGWTKDHSIDAVFPRTAAEIIKYVQQAVNQGIPHGTPGHPSEINGKLRNPDTGEITTYKAVNSGVGVWALEIEKPIYGESVMPLRFVMDKDGVREVKVAGPKSTN